MPIDRDGTDTPEAELPALAGRYRAPDQGQVRHTFASRLVPVVDGIRQLYARFGIRPYRVFMIHARWTGGEPGVGYQEIVSRIEIEPTPLVTGIGALDAVLRATGATEEGEITVEQISARYTEDDLLGRTPDLRDPNLPRSTALAFDFYWEVLENRGQAPNPVIRRFSPVGVPELKRDAFQWRIQLVKQDYDRGRRGEVEREAF